MSRRPWPILLPAALLACLAGCSDDDDAATPTTTAAVTATEPTTPTTPATTLAPTVAPTTAAPPTTPAPAPTSPPSVISDTEAVGGSSLSTLDLATGAATSLGDVGSEVGVLGIAVTPDGTIDAVTDAPELLVLDRTAPGAPGRTTSVDADGDTLLALARRGSDGALFALGATGGVFRLDPATGTTTLVAEIAVDDPGVGLDVAADGTLEIVVATGARFAVDPDSGDVTELPAPSADEAPARIVAIAHDATARYGIDAAADELVTIADDGTVDTVGPLGLDATDGASLDIGPDGVAVLANPG